MATLLGVTKDAATVAAWGSGLKSLLRGFRPGASPAEVDAAHQYLKHEGTVTCHRCGKTVQAHKGGFQKHIDTAFCKAVTAPVNAVLWILAAPKPEVVSVHDRADEITGLATLLLESHGVAVETASKLFAKGGVLMRALMSLKGELPSRRTMVRRRGEQVAELQAAVGPQIRVLLGGGSMTVMVDESSTTAYGGMYVTAIMAYSAAVSTPILVDIHGSSASMNADKLGELVYQAFVQEGRLTAEEFATSVHGLSSDHAAYNKKAARDQGWNWWGDAPHALDLCVKRALKNWKTPAQVLAVTRRTMRSKSPVVSRHAAAFGVPLSLFTESATRWTASVKLVEWLAVAKNWARMQQFALACPAVAAGGAGAAAEEHDTDDESDAEPAVAELPFADLFSDAATLAEMRAAAVLLAPFKQAQEVTQHNEVTATISAATLTALNKAGDAIAALGGSVADAQACLAEAATMVYGPLEVASSAGELPAPVALFDVVVGEETVTATLKPDAVLAPQYKLLKHGTKTGAAAVAPWRKDIATAAQHAAACAAKPWNDWGSMSWRVADRRQLASAIGKAVEGVDTARVKEAVEDEDGVPRNMKWAERADDDELPHKASFIAEAVRQWEAMKAIHLGTAAHDCQPTAAEVADPRLFWIRMRALKRFKNLTTVMLLWLSAPISTSSLERAFSFLTQVRNDLSRHRLTREHVLECMWAHVHAAAVRARLEAALAAVPAGKRVRMGGDAAVVCAGAGGGMDED